MEEVLDMKEGTPRKRGEGLAECRAGGEGMKGSNSTKCCERYWAILGVEYGVAGAERDEEMDDGG